MPGPRLTLASICAICGKPLDDARSHDDALDVALFGAARFAQCIGCERVVAPPWTPEYQQRWNNRFNELRWDSIEPLQRAWNNGVLAAQGAETFAVCDLPIGAERDAWADGWLFIWRGGTKAGSASAFQEWFVAKCNTKPV
jgi:hypothetical protein